MPGDKPSSRREFLRGRSAARALLDAARGLADGARATFDNAGALPPPQRAAPRRSTAGVHLAASRRAMACEFAIQYHAADGPGAADAALSGLDLVEAIEDQLSIYREHTET